MRFRDTLLKLLRLQPRLISLAYDQLYYWLFLRFFFGDQIKLIGQSGIRIHHSTSISMHDSKIIIENGILRIGYESLLNSKGKCGLALRCSSLKILGNVELRPNTGIWATNTEISIGDGTVINGPTSIISKAGIEIGRSCHIAMNTMIMDCDLHKYAFNGEKPKDTAKEIVIKDRCWIGHNVTILKGVTIGEGSIIGARSVVTKDVEARTMVAGVPAKKIRDKVIWEP